MVCLQGHRAQLLLTTNVLVGGSESELLSSYQPQVETSVEEDKWCVHVPTSHLGIISICRVAIPLVSSL